MWLIQANLKTTMVGTAVRVAVDSGGGSMNYLNGAIIKVTIQDEDGSDTLLVRFYAPDLYTAPTFQTSSYMFYVSDATQNGDTLGRLVATDRDGLAINYSVDPTLSPYVVVDSSHDVVVTDADGLRAAIQAGGSALSLAGTASATNTAYLTGTASVTIKLRNDPGDLNDAIRDYIDTWYDAGINNANYVNSVVTQMIDNHINDIVGNWQYYKTLAGDITNGIWAVSSFVEGKVRGLSAAALIGTGAVAAQILGNRLYFDPNIAGAEAARTLMKQDCTSTVLLNTTNAYLTLKGDLLSDWSDAKQAIDGQTDPGSPERSRQYADYLRDLRNSLTIDPPLTFTANEIWLQIKKPD